MKKILLSPTFVTGFFLAIIMGALLMIVSQKTEVQKRTLAALQQELNIQEDTKMLLEAEWAYLNRPERIEFLITEFRNEGNMVPAKLASSDMTHKVVGAIPEVKYAPQPVIKPSDFDTTLAMYRGR